MVIWDNQCKEKSESKKSEAYFKKRRLANKFLVCYYLVKYPELIKERKKKSPEKESAKKEEKIEEKKEELSPGKKEIEEEEKKFEQSPELKKLKEEEEDEIEMIKLK